LNKNRTNTSSVVVNVFILSAVLFILITGNSLYPQNIMAKLDKAKTDQLKSSDSFPDSGKPISVKFEKNIPAVKLSYQGHTYAMLPFVVVEGNDVKKINFPQLPDDFQPVVSIPQGQSFSVAFDSKPRETNALVIDYDADVTAVSPVNKLGTNSFSVSDVSGPRTLEIRAIYPDDRYVTYTLLIDFGKSQALSLANSPENPQAGNEMNGKNVQSVNPNYESNSQFKSINSLNGENGGKVDTLENKIANVYGSMLNEGSVIKPGPTIFASQDSSSNDGCLVEEIPIHTLSTNDNASLTNSALGNNTNTSEQTGPWVLADLGAEKQVCGVKVQLNQAIDEVKFFTVSLSLNGTSFTPPKYFSNTGTASAPEIYNFGGDPVSARYIKLTEIGKVGADPGWLTDLKVLGTAE